MLGTPIERSDSRTVNGYMPHVSDGAMLGSLFEERGVSQADVVRGTGIGKTVLLLVRNGKRNLTREHTKALSRYFEVDPAVFFGPA
jgi:transcriptional regulator with XRE-family HTH domain